MNSQRDDSLAGISDSKEIQINEGKLNKKKYAKPRILFRKPLEAFAVACLGPYPAKAFVGPCAAGALLS